MIKSFFVGALLLLFSISTYAHVTEIRVNQNQDGSLTWYLQTYHRVNQCGIANSGININGVNYPINAEFAGSTVNLSPTVFATYANVNPSLTNNRQSYAIVNTPYIPGNLNVNPYSNNACWAFFVGGNGSFTPPPPPVCTSFPITGASNTLGTPSDAGTTCEASDDSIPVSLSVGHLACGNITGDGQFTAFLDPNGANILLGNVNYNSGITTPLNFNLPANINAQVKFVDNDFPSDSFTYNISGLNGNVFAGVPDIVPPTVTAQNVTVNLDANGQATIVSNNSKSTVFSETFSSDTPGLVSSLVNWNVTGNVDVGNYISGNNGQEIDLAGNNNATITSKNSFVLTPGDYELSFDHRLNNNPTGGNSVNVKIGTLFNQTFNSPSTAQKETVTFTVSNSESATITLQQLGIDDAAGSFIGDFKLSKILSPSFLIYNDATDSCGISSISVSKSTFDCSNIGENTVTLSATDSNGNVGSTNAIVTVVDDQSPTVLTQNITIQLDVNGSASITTSEIDNGSFDNCDIATLSLDKTNFDCSNVGQNTVNLTALDTSSNSASTAAIVTVLDVQPINAQLDTFTLESCGSFDFTTADLLANDTDPYGRSLKIDFIDQPANGTIQDNGNGNYTFTPNSLTNQTFTANYTVKPNDGTTVFTGNGHFYEFVPSAGITWTAAKAEAETKYYQGLQGYLVTITSQEENDFAFSKIGAQGWIGASDSAVEGQWVWATGPETGQIFWSGLSNGGPVNDAYNAWGGGEPNNAGNEDYAHFRNDGKWNDFPLNAGQNIQGYVVEYGGNNTDCNTQVTATGLINFILDDQEPPTISGQDITVTLTASGTVSIAATDVLTGSADNCDVTDYTLNQSTFGVNDAINSPVTIQLTGTDVNGNSTSVPVQVTVIDPVPVIITKNITIELDENGAKTITPEEIDNGSSSVVGLSGLSLDITSFDCSNIGENTVNLTVTSNLGNSISAPAIVTVIDNIAPVINTPAALTVNTNNDDCGHTFETPLSAGATDNCGIESVIGTRSDGLALTDIYPVGETVITWVATDVNGNISNQGNGGSGSYSNQIFTNPSQFSNDAVVLDFEELSSGTLITTDQYEEEGVVFTQDNGQTPGIGADGTPRIFGTPGFNILNNYSNGFSNPYPNVIASFTNGTNRVGFEIRTNNGDNLDVNILCVKNGTVIGTESFQTDLSFKFIGIESAQSFDQIIIDVNGSSNGAFNLDNFTFEGSQSTTQTITVIDNQLPNVLVNDISINLSESGTSSITVADIDNSSNDACGIANLELDITTFDCSNVGENTVTLTATDVNGNVSSKTAVVTVNDITPPVVVTTNFSINLDENGEGSITVANINNGSTDTCGIESLVLDITAFNCSNVGENTVTLIATDVNGNVASKTASVTVKDVTAPIVNTNNISIDLDVNGQISISPEMIDNDSSDACGIETLVLDITSFDCSNVGENTVVLTATDVNGNMASQTATVTVNDVTAPVVLTKDLSIDLDANGNATITPDLINNGSTDACGVATLVLDTTSFDCSNVGENTVNLTVKDVNGNVASQSATVTINDATAPTVITQSFSMDLANGVVNITPSDIDGGSFDNCEFTLSIDKDRFTCDDIGDHVVTLTATDASGNTSSNTAIVSVIGDVPTISINNFYAVQTQKKNTIFLGFGPQNINLSTVVTGGSGFTYEWTTSSGEIVSNEANPNISPEVSTTYNVTVTNSNGCSASTSVYVCVIDARSFDKKGRYKGKVKVCHHTNGKKGTKHVEISISPNAVMTHLTKHGVGTDHADTLGGCNATCVDNSGSKATTKTSIAAASISDNLSIYPNPSNGIFDIRLTALNLDTDILLFDATGKLIQRKFISKEISAENIITIGDLNLSSGFYILKIITKNETISKKLIVAKE